MGCQPSVIELQKVIKEDEESTQNDECRMPSRLDTLSPNYLSRQLQANSIAQTCRRDEEQKLIELLE